MSDLGWVIYCLAKEAFKPELHHSSLTEYLDDVDRALFKKTHSFSYTKYTSKLRDLI
uniref:hypothetical protein n=1 Tax=Lactobacillus acidophilus TaxID=1579 RepID=UPI003F56CCBD